MECPGDPEKKTKHWFEYFTDFSSGINNKGSNSFSDWAPVIMVKTFQLTLWLSINTCSKYPSFNCFAGNCKELNTTCTLA